MSAGWPDQPSRRKHDHDLAVPESPEKLADAVTQKLRGEDKTVTDGSSRGAGWPDQPSRR